MVHRNVGNNTMALLQKTFERLSQLTSYGIYVYECETKQQSNMWAFEDKPNPTKVVCAKITSKQMVACFFGKTGHVQLFHLSNVPRSILSGTPQFLCRNSKNEHKKTNHCSKWQSHIGSSQRPFNCLKRRIDGSSAAQPLTSFYCQILRGQRFSPNTNFS